MVLPDRVLAPGWVECDDGVIVAVGEGELPGRKVADGWLVPGFVDQHTHGAMGRSFEDTSVEAVSEAVGAMHARGATSVIASLVSAAPDALHEQVGQLADRCDEDLIAGIHLEGPWISPTFKGAHDPEVLRNPTVAEFEELLVVGRGHIKMVTLAPELPGALDVIAVCADRGVVAAVGHTDATFEQVEAAIDAGATVATHLFNAMRPLRHRDPGPIAALTEDPRVTCELIMDGIHLEWPVARLARRAAEDRLVLVTDSMAAACVGDGDYMLGTLEVQVRNGCARLVSNGSIAGSTLTMDAAFRNFVNATDAPVPIAVRAASTTPSVLMQLRDRGEIRAGLRADLVRLNDDLELQEVWRGGEPVTG